LAVYALSFRRSIDPSCFKKYVSSKNIVSVQKIGVHLRPAVIEPLTEIRYRQGKDHHLCLGSSKTMPAYNQYIHQPHTDTADDHAQPSNTFRDRYGARTFHRAPSPESSTGPPQIAIPCMSKRS
jgi:hypothetical protein